MKPASLFVRFVPWESLFLGEVRGGPGLLMLHKVWMVLHYDLLGVGIAVAFMLALVYAVTTAIQILGSGKT